MEVYKNFENSRKKNDNKIAFNAEQIPSLDYINDQSLKFAPQIILDKINTTNY